MSLITSLKHMVLAKIAIQLWGKHNELKAILAERNYWWISNYYEMKVVVKTREKVETLQLPPSVKIQLLSTTIPIGIHICDWCVHLSNHFEVKNINLQNLRWTSYGTIDKVKSVQSLLQRDGNLDQQQRYDLACNFCLVDEMQALIKQKEKLRKIKLPFRANSRQVQANEQDLVAYFTQYLKHRLVILARDPVAYLSPYHEACHVAIVSRNPTATKYFYQKLSSEEKNLILSLVAVQFRENPHLQNIMDGDRVCFADLMSFLFSNMNQTQRDHLLSRPTAVFNSLLLWPCKRDLLLEIANRLWELGRERDFDRLLFLIFSQFKNDNGYFEYRELYFELWRSSPVQFEGFHVDNMIINRLFNYFEAGQVEVCQMLLSKANASKKERLIVNGVNHYYGALPACSKNWSFFKFLVEQCVISREMIIMLKKEVMNYGLGIDKYDTSQHIQFLDNFHLDEKRM